MRKSTLDAMVARQLHLPLPLQREALEAAQFRLLREALVHARNRSPFYARHFKHIEPEHIRSRQELANLPFLPKEAIRSSALPLQCLSQSAIARIVTLATSGSTGKPKRIAFDAADLQSIVAFFQQGMQNLLRKQDAALILLPADTPSSTGDLLHKALQKSGNPSFVLWPPEVEQAVQLITRHHIRTAIGLPQHLLALSCHIATLSHMVPGTIRTMLLCSDYAPQVVRKRIEQNCGCTTFIHYGTTESGLGGGVECEAHAGCHVWEGELLLEIIDPQTNTPLPDGQVGEIVLTTLSRRCMPLFRYRTGDWAALVRTPCACGARTARLVSILGRHLEYVLEDGFVLTSQQLDEWLFAEPALLDYRASLHRRNGREGLDIDYLASGPLPAETLRQRLPGCLPAGRTEQRDADFFRHAHTVKRMICDARGER